MAFLTFNELSSRTFFKEQDLNESISGRTQPSRKLFLPYRHSDRHLVHDVVRFLKGLGVAVYIDYMDQTLEEQTNENVAKTLRNHIQASSKFISLAIPNSGSSKWMPWELGLGDRIINYPNVGILPVTNRADYWPDQEYGRIYGRIENIPSWGFPKEDTWYIIYPDGQRKDFKQWLLN